MTAQLSVAPKSNHRGRWSPGNLRWQNLLKIPSPLQLASPRFSPPRSGQIHSSDASGQTGGLHPSLSLTPLITAWMVTFQIQSHPTISTAPRVEMASLCPLTACFPWGSGSESMILNKTGSPSTPNVPGPQSCPSEAEPRPWPSGSCVPPVLAATQTPATTGPSTQSALVIPPSCCLSSALPSAERSPPSPLWYRLWGAQVRTKDPLSRECPPATLQPPRPRSHLLPHRKRAWSSHPRSDLPSGATPSQDAPTS